MILTIIVPVYNVEKYLERCLESALAAVKGLPGGAEILTINNNSTDNSLAILEEYARKHRGVIRVETCKTPGLAAVRNFGMAQAKGKYTWFVDSDDEITPESAKLLIEAAEALPGGADLTTLGLAKVYPDGHRDVIPALRADDPEFRSKFIRNEPGSVQVLIRRKWYREHDFQFLEGRFHEDMELMPALILYTDKIASVDEVLYLYYQNPGSILHPTEWDEHYFDIFPVLEGLHQRFQKAGAVERYHAELEWFFIWNLLMDSAGYFRAFPEGREGLSRSREMLRRYFPGWWRNKFLKRTSLRTRLRIYRNYWGF